MNPSNFRFDFSELNLDVRQIEKIMGYKDGESNEAVYEDIVCALKEAGMVCDMKAEYRIFEVTEFDNTLKSVQINNTVFNLKKIVYSQLRKASSIAVFVSTAGEEIGRLSREAMREGDLVRGYILDVIGSEAADGASGLMQDRLREAASTEGLEITNRYSPGYCDWNVDEQHKLFRLMTDNYCGISVNSSALMTPEKSVSGFIGIGKDVRYNQYTCNLCDMKDCIYRRLRGSL